MDTLSLQQLLSLPKEAALYVLNTSAESAIGAAGEVFLTVPKVNGTGSDNVVVSQTWLPQDLTTQVSRDQLLASTSFRKALSSRLLAAITEKDANRALRAEGAEEEQERLDEMRRRIRAAGAARTIADSGATIHLANGAKETDVEEERTSIKDDGESIAEKAARGLEEVEAGITPQFSMWVDRINTGTDMAARNEIKGRQRFTKRELRFLNKHLHKNFVKARQLISKNL